MIAGAARASGAATTSSRLSDGPGGDPAAPDSASAGPDNPAAPTTAGPDIGDPTDTGHGKSSGSRRADGVDGLLARARGGDRWALGRLLTYTERGGALADAVATAAWPLVGGAHVVGITGAPGVGKSTLTDCLARAAGDDGRRVAILAVDPSSPLTGGAILGDRVRMTSAAQPNGPFVRSMASRGQSGGLALAALAAARLLDACGHDLVIVETVGIGQVEVDIANAADTTVVAVSPGWGDAVQANKAGLLELADIFVVNKADRAGAADARRDLEYMLDLGQAGDWRPPIVLTVATEGTGAAEMWQKVQEHWGHLAAGRGRDARRAAQAAEEVRRHLHRSVDILFEHPSEGAEKLFAEVTAGRLAPGAAAQHLAAELLTTQSAPADDSAPPAGTSTADEARTDTAHGAAPPAAGTGCPAAGAAEGAEGDGAGAGGAAEGAGGDGADGGNGAAAAADPLLGGDGATVITGWRQAREALRSKEMRQAMYDEGAVIMQDCLLVLHGDAHRRRRRVENRLFRREVFTHWERTVLGSTLEAVLAPFLAGGRADLRALGYRAAISLTATIAGVDHDPANVAHTSRLEGFVRSFSAGATLAHSTRDRDEVRAEVRSQLAAFRHEMLDESLQRRRELLADLAAGRIAEADLPRDVATLLLRHQDDLELATDVLEREICFYLQAGAHSTADTFTHALDELFTHGAAHPDDLARAGRDPAFAQRCVHESLRLNPASPVAWREPLGDVTLRDGTLLPAGTRVVIDLRAVNRDPTVWGADAGVFDPHRTVPEGCNAWGLSFGAGAHACIGAELDGGMELLGNGAPDADHLYGTVPVIVAAVLAAGGRPDPDNPPTADPNTRRPHFSSYPIIFAPDHRNGRP